MRAIVADSGAIPSAIIDQRAAVGANRQSGVDQILVKDAPGVGADRAHAAIKKVIAGYPVAEVQTAKEFADGIGSQLNGMLNMVYALLALAVLIALVGIANTLGLSILERTRELGVLRAVGMSRAQVRSTIRWEAVLIAAAGTVRGVPSFRGGADDPDQDDRGPGRIGGRGGGRSLFGSAGRAGGRSGTGRGGCVRMDAER